MNRGISEQRKWLDKVHSALKWKVDGPNLRNPFDSLSSNAKLEEYVLDRSVLMANCTVKAFMDETEIIKITDLNDLIFDTAHPNVVDIDRGELQNYLEQKGVWATVEKEVSDLQRRCAEELKSRGGG